MSDGWCADCGYGGSGHAVPVNDGESLCTGCAAKQIRVLRQQRYRLADVLGYQIGGGSEPEYIPPFDSLLMQVGRLVKTKTWLIKVRAFLRGEYDNE